MKNIFNYRNIAACALAFTALVSCNDDDVTYASSKKSIATADQTTFTAAEGDVVNVTLNIDTPYREPMDFKLELVGGSGSNEDFTTSGLELSVGDGLGSLPADKITVPANASSFTFQINPIVDIFPEGSETLIFALTSSGNGLGLVGSGSETIKVTVDNTESDDFLWRMSWNDTFVGTDGEEHDFCDSFNVDLDLEIYDAGFGGPLATSYGNCPEEILINLGDLADGDYWLIPSFWSQEAIVPTGLTIPTSMTFAKPGVWLENVDLSDVWNTTDGGNQQGNANAYLVKYQLNINGNVYTVTDTDSGIIIGTGKAAGFIPGARGNK